MSSTLRTTLVSFALVATSAMALPALAAPHAGHEAKPPTAVASAIETRQALRDLWIGHVFWVRNVVVATLDGDSAAAATAEQQVVANAKQIAGAIEPFYGKAASEQLFSLLAGHYGAVKQHLEATIAKNPAGQDAAVKTLTANADQIAVFLSGANPNLPADTLRALLFAHGGHHVQQNQQLHGKRYAEEAQTWAAMTQHMYVIADALASAIAKQFPAKFN